MWLIGAGAFLLAIGLAILKGMSIQKNKTKLAQKDVELKTLKAVHKAKDKAKEVTDENNKKSDDGDWSGLNR